MTNLILGTALGFLLSSSMAIIDGIRVRRNYIKSLNEIGQNQVDINKELATFKDDFEKAIKDKHNDKVEELRLRIFHNYSLVDLMLTDNPPEDKSDYAKMLQDEAVKIKYDKEKVLKLIDQIIEY